MEDWDTLDPVWKACFELMWEAYCAGSVPVGAVVVDPDGVVVARGRNRIFDPHDGFVGTRLAHAEVTALAQLPSTDRYPEHTVYSTLEPCLLCLGAVNMCHVGRIAYAADDPYAGACRIPPVTPMWLARPVAIEGPLGGGFALLSQSLVIVHCLARDAPFHVVEPYPDDAHRAAERIRTAGDGLPAALADALPRLSELLS